MRNRVQRQRTATGLDGVQAAGRSLNIAENELSSMTRQCVQDRRFGTIGVLRKEKGRMVSAQQRQATRRRLATAGRRREG